MKIMMEKFGTTLISRQAGKEALAAFAPVLAELHDDEKIEVDFRGVNTFSPSWADEFLRGLVEKYGEKVILRNTENPSVRTTLSFLESIGYKKFTIE